MIPHYSTPFGPARVMAAMLSPRTAPSVGELEFEFAAALGVRAAVIVPSVRSAILLLLRSALTTDTLVVGPAYTCPVVHEAMALSGARLRYLEPTAKGFLLPASNVVASSESDACLILSEIYGLTYQDSFLRATDELRLRLRILDMAMGIPDRERLQRMKPNDVGLFSFGFGKAMCAGGGGLACFADEGLAATVRDMRDELVSENSRMARLKGDLRVLASVSIRTRLLCRPAIAAKTWQEGLGRSRHTADRSGPKKAPQTLGPEWTHTMTALERRLAAHNLRHANASAQLRREQAHAYADHFRAIGGVLPDFDGDTLPQSHFPVRVPASMRGPLKAYLGARGIEAGDEFAFSGLLCRKAYPWASAASSEVLTLPMGEPVSMGDIKRIAQAIGEGLQP
jgi:dTDP-4-amino-4,6-dideoxygalactose transaminase